MTNQISIALRTTVSAGIAALCALSAATNATAAQLSQSACARSRAAALTEVNVAIANYGKRLVAVGRVDAVTQSDGVEVLGVRVQPTAGDEIQVGDYVAVVNWATRGAKEALLEVRPLASRYVPGASEIYLKLPVVAVDALRGRVKVGRAIVDHSASSISTKGTTVKKGTVLTVRGTQPAPQGVILGGCVLVTGADGSLGTGRPDGSLGTGSPDGSLGTGAPDGSLGTGSPDGSLGTGAPDGSLGTGSPDGSLGTGSPDGSLGTGSPDGSLGTGSPDGSLGTGSSAG